MRLSLNGLRCPISQESCQRSSRAVLACQWPRCSFGFFGANGSFHYFTFQLLPGTALSKGPPGLMVLLRPDGALKRAPSEMLAAFEAGQRHEDTAPENFFSAARRDSLGAYPVSLPAGHVACRLCGSRSTGLFIEALCRYFSKDGAAMSCEAKMTANSCCCSKLTVISWTTKCIFLSLVFCLLSIWLLSSFDVCCLFGCFVLFVCF